MTIDAIIANTEALSINQVIEESVSETTEELKNYQQQQMYSGMRADGEPINPLHGKYAGYALRTVQIKQSKGQVTNRVTLRDERNFYLGIVVTPKNNAAEFTSADGKTDLLIDYYGPQIFGLNKDFAGLYSNNDLKPLAIRKIQEQILR
jgi:hypothetical protein